MPSLRQRLLRRLRPATRPAAPAAPTAPRRTLADYALRDAALRTLQPEDLDPRFRAAAERGDPAAVAVQVHPGVYALPLLDAAWCRRLLAEVDHLEAWCRRHRVEPERPNTMNRYGLVLAEVGLDPAIAALRADWLQQLSARLYPELGADRLDGHHAFIVDYQQGGDIDLSLHVDDSELTVNLCLGPGFSGGELHFEGRRCMAHLQDGALAEEQWTWSHQPGVALLHTGKHRHSARAIVDGRRRNLVLWLRSEGWRARDAARWEAGACPEWCGHEAWKQASGVSSW